MNTWRSNGATPLPKEALGLHKFSIILPGESARQRLQDSLTRHDIAVETSGGAPVLYDPAGIAIRPDIKE